VVEESTWGVSDLAGVVVALFACVVARSSLKFVIEPVQDQKRLMGEVAQALSIHAHIGDTEAPQYGATLCKSEK
jgi:hypothetical protein